ncbi:MAG: hypothetical protein FJ121_12625 [Deltaproteobacteria bacterium]|nr:hypothetical protein [Deltaproteobacteria bacterium]
MKKIIVFAVVLALLVPAAAFAATEFSLGGFIKLDAMWDSDSSVHKNLFRPPARNNDSNVKHGRLMFTAQGSRFSFTIKGPDLWSAKTSGFLEMDFDAAQEGVNSIAFGGASRSYTPRLRHAMFRFNWPTSELLFGQFWSMFCEWYAESAEDGPLMMTGTPTARLAQVRFTQKFMSDWTVAALIGDPNQATLPATAYYNVPENAINNGRAAESPQVQGKVQYQHDFWGKAAYYGRPIPFTAQVVAGWQRNVLRQQNFALNTLGTNINSVGAVVENALSANANFNSQNQYLNPWMVMGSLFIPVIPTHTANLAGTASILTQWWIGQGVEVFGFSGVASNLYKFNNNLNQKWTYDAYLLKKFGGFVEGQYYFNNQWFVNALYAVSKAYGVSRARYNWIAGINGLNSMEWGMGDNAHTIQQASVTLWYRPIQAFKFGLQYSYAAAHYYQYILPTARPALVPAAPANTVNRSNFGDSHRVEFVGFFYF